MYYFPSSKPIVQYPRETTERFYKRKPVKQYPKEEVPYWRTRYQKPVRVVERESTYPTADYNYRVSNKIIENTPEYRARYFSMNDNSIMYRDYDDSSYYYETDLNHQPFSSITRPCSPVYSRDTWYDKTRSENPKSLLEKKIRDYVWNPHKKRVENYLFPNYEKSTYYSDFKPLRNKRQENYVFHTRPSLLEFDSQVENKKNEASYEILSERKHSEDKSTLRQKDDDNFSNDPLYKNNDCKNIPWYKKNSEIPVHYVKRISFDLHNENIEIPNRKNSIGENSNANSTTKQPRLNLEKREPSTKLDDQRRTSLLSNDDYSVTSNKQRILPSTDKNINSKLESTNRLEPDDNRLNFKNNFPKNCSNPLEKNSFNVSDVKKVNYDHVNYNTRLYQEIQDDKNKNVLKPKDISNENAGYCELIRSDSNDSRRKLTGTTEKSKFIQRAENVQSSDKRDYDSNVMKRRESYKDEWKTTKENIPGSRKNSNNVSGDRLNDNYPQTGGLNESQSFAVDREINEYVMAGREADRIEQSITEENENVTAEIMDVTLPLCDGFDSKMQVSDRPGKQPEDISNDGDQDYYHSRGRIEDVERFTVVDENYYLDEPLAANGENEENIVATTDEYYNYQNPAANVTRENDVDDYYHRDSYSNDDVVTTTSFIDSAALREEYHPENELAIGGKNDIPPVTAASLDDYNNYYQNPATDGTSENNVDDYYHRDGYSNDDVVTTTSIIDSAALREEYHPEDELAVGGENDIPPVTAAPMDDYNNYYQNSAANGTRENIDENYYSSGERLSMAAEDGGYYYENAGEERREGNDDGQYAEHADYYYQNYSEMDRTAIGQGGEYAEDERVEHDHYYSERREGGNGDDTRRSDDYYYGGSESVGGGDPEAAKSTVRQTTDDGDFYYGQLGENYDGGVTNNSYYPNSHPDNGGGGDYDVKSYDYPTGSSDYNYSENIVTVVDENQSPNL